MQYFSRLLHYSKSSHFSGCFQKRHFRLVFQRCARSTTEVALSTCFLKMRTLNNRSGTFDLFFKDAHAKQQRQLSPKNLMESKMGDKALTYLSLRKMV